MAHSPPLSFRPLAAWDPLAQWYTEGLPPSSLRSNSVHHLGIEPYQYEPYLSDAGAGEDGGSEGDGTGSDEDDEGSERLGNNEWLVAFYS